MDLEKLLDEWEKDCEINPLDMTEESIKSGRLHSKYYNIFVREKLRLVKLKSDKKLLYRDLYDYFTGDISQETLKERGWEPRNRRILKTEMDIHLESNEDWINFNLKYALQEEKVNALEAMLKVINNRSFQISNIINWEKFKNGN